MDDIENFRTKIKKLEYSNPGELGFRLADVFGAMIPLLQPNKQPFISATMEYGNGPTLAKYAAKPHNPTQNPGEPRAENATGSQEIGVSRTAHFTPNRVETEYECERCGITWVMSCHPDAPFTFVDCGCPNQNPEDKQVSIGAAWGYGLRHQHRKLIPSDLVSFLILSKRLL